MSVLHEKNAQSIHERTSILHTTLCSEIRIQILQGRLPRGAKMIQISDMKKHITLKINGSEWQFHDVVTYCVRTDEFKIENLIITQRHSAGWLQKTEIPTKQIKNIEITMERDT